MCLVTFGKWCSHEANSGMAWSQWLFNYGKHLRTFGLQLKADFGWRNAGWLGACSELKKKNQQPEKPTTGVVSGGDGGIRTHVVLIAPKRFRVVLVMTASIRLQVFISICFLLYQTCPYLAIALFISSFLGKRCRTTPWKELIIGTNERKIAAVWSKHFPIELDNGGNVLILNIVKKGPQNISENILSQTIWELGIRTAPSKPIKIKLIVPLILYILVNSFQQCLPERALFNVTIQKADKNSHYSPCYKEIKWYNCL